MQTEQSCHPILFTVEVAGHDLEFRQVRLDDRTATGAQIAAAARFKPDQLPIVLQLLDSGAQEDIRPEETVTLHDGVNRFIVIESDRKYILAVDGARLEWPCAKISGHTVRKLAEVDPAKRLLLEREDEADLEVEDSQLIDLDAAGIERFVTRKAIWKLNIQGEVYDFSKPIVSVREAISAASLDPNQNWQIFLIVRDEPKRALTIDDQIDLRPAGIEKLRLTQKDVSNGETAMPVRREFKLLDRDEQHLNAAGHHWETRLTSGGGHWLLIHDYQLPSGYSEEVVQLALNIPSTYPSTAMDMFYLYPAVRKADGALIPQTEATVDVDGVPFQRWSRHRAWNPMTDNVMTQLAMADGCIHKEVDL
ncbi:multiubiquitin domain-containing protein [Pseudomonas sp. MAFF 302046]|uniref:Multiubiquitin domain-containing protein n=1 Tax=Pseudomonas morbosilactucae TaxID=2938197 RepID=A0ABT0JJ02_9PSED|nr:multiubiquitin domain-containing protein [Pseudomonas morbosilactucae]MCK9815884.1 multiubiquitin domain-containing protein [Pseudomonas morbosilactucae]